MATRCSMCAQDDTCHSHVKHTLPRSPHSPRFILRSSRFFGCNWMSRCHVINTPLIFWAEISSSLKIWTYNFPFKRLSIILFYFIFLCHFISHFNTSIQLSPTQNYFHGNWPFEWHSYCLQCTQSLSNRI